MTNEEKPKTEKPQEEPIEQSENDSSEQPREVEEQSEEQSEEITVTPHKDSKPNYWAIPAVFIAVIIIVAFIVYVSNTAVVTENPYYYDYNGFTFEYKPDAKVWSTQVAHRGGTLYTIATYYGPLNTTDIPIDNLTYQTLLSKRQIYLSLDLSTNVTYEGGMARATIAANEIGRVLGEQVIGIPTNGSVTFEQSQFDWPVITCANATNKTGVVVFQLGEDDRVITQDHCVIVQGSSPKNLVRVADRVLFNILGIMR